MVPLIDLTLDKKILAQIKKEILRTVDSKSYILGKEVESFEKKFAHFIGSYDAIGVANGTDALSLSLRALGIGAGDKVLTVAFTSPFTSIAIVEEGAVPVYCDVDEDTWTIDVEDCARKIDKSVKAIMPVHIYGNPCNMKAILGFAKENKLKVIEDACQAHNATFDGKKIGTFGDAAGFSFYPTKNLGGFGDGGIVTTMNNKTANMVRILRHGGQTKRFWHVYEGKNSRLDEIQAAILATKLKFLNKNHKMRGEVAKKYQKELAGIVQFQKSHPGGISSNHLFVVRAPRRDKLHLFLKKWGIESGIYYPYPVHTQPAFLKYSKNELPVSEGLARELLAIPLSPNLSAKDQEYVISKIKRFYK